MTDSKLQSWQLWAAMKKALGESEIMRVLGKRDARIIRMYAQNPRSTADRCHDPIENLHALLYSMDEIGRGDVARRILAYLETALDESYPSAPEPLKPTMDAEQLADFQSVAAFQKAINDGSDADLVELLMKEAQEEIGRTFAKYLER